MVCITFYLSSAQIALDTFACTYHTHNLNSQCYFTNSIVLQEEFYGLGTVRTPEKFYETFGIDVRQKKTVKFLCRFVEGGKMHHLFMPNLRSDGMGIDYSKITYKHS